MARKDLIPFNRLTKEEQKKLASMGGKASVKSRKKKKELKERISLALEFLTEKKAKLANTPELKKKIEEVGYDIYIILEEIEKGNLQAIDRFWDRLYGKPIAKNELTGADGGAIQIAGNSIKIEKYNGDSGKTNSK